MADNILVPFDGSPLSERALEHTLEKFPSALITAIYVINPIESVIAVEAGGLPVAEEWHDNAQEQANMVHAAAKEQAANHEVELSTHTVVGRPAREILEYAEEHDIDQIIMGSHSRDWVERAILGSVAETVMRRASIPVTIVR
jgi:nucleotide-binding universal stress UspA family protein